MGMVLAAPQPRVLAWGMHPRITKAAVVVLAEQEQSALGAESGRFINEYCLIPDWVYSRKDLAPFAMRDDKPGVLYDINLHLPPAQQEMFATILSFLGRAAEAWRAGNQADALKFLGTLSHALQDWGCPAHTVPGDNQFNLMRQFLPPPVEQTYRLIHGPMEGGSLLVDIAGYKPVVLGDTVAEVAFRLLHRAVGSVVFEVYADGKSVGRAGPLTADSPAHQFSVPLKGVSAIRLVASGGAPAAAEGNYAVWGRPQLLK